MLWHHRCCQLQSQLHVHSAHDFTSHKGVGTYSETCEVLQRAARSECSACSLSCASVLLGPCTADVAPQNWCSWRKTDMGYMVVFELIRGLATQLNSMSTELDALGQHGTGQQ